MQEVSEKYNNDSYRERHALSVERLRTLPFEESVEDSYIAYFRLVALFCLKWKMCGFRWKAENGINIMKKT